MSITHKSAILTIDIGRQKSEPQNPSVLKTNEKESSSTNAAKKPLQFFIFSLKRTNTLLEKVQFVWDNKTQLKSS